MTLKAAVAQAIDEIRTRFAGHDVQVREDGEGGAIVTVGELVLGPPYTQATTWLSARIVCTYPYADVYPHFVRPDLTRVDGRALGVGTSLGRWEDAPAIQLSRRTSGLDASVDRADLKYLKVIEWLRTGP